MLKICSGLGVVQIGLLRCKIYYPYIPSLGFTLVENTVSLIYKDQQVNALPENNRLFTRN